jgi:RimJ/RimL family protein N-acetyltransferase
VEIPVIHTPRLILRGYTLADMPPMHAILCDREVIRYIPRNEPWPYAVVQGLYERQQCHWQRHGYGWWAAEDRASGELLGWCGLGFLAETNETEIKYLFKRSHWGKGLASEGALCGIHYAFSTLNLNSVIGLVHPDNIASQKVLEHSGLVFCNQARYFGWDLLRYTIDRQHFEELEM